MQNGSKTRRVVQTALKYDQEEGGLDGGAVNT